MEVDKIKDIIYNKRKALNLTLEEVGKYVGVGKSTVRKWETGDIENMKRDKISLICEILQLDPLIFVSGSSSTNHIKGVKIPLLGRVVAGVPMEAIENIEGYEEITPTLAAKGSYFALRVAGKSMEPFFLENDIVIVRKTKSIESGAIAIVLVNGCDATVKKVKIQDDGVTLIGFNTSVYEPHFYNSNEVKSLPVEIIGEVVESKRILVNV
jgi:repressor LexA